MANSTKSGGMGLAGVLTVIFIVLKLVHVIDWSWFWVLSPMIFSIALVVLVIIIIALIAFIANK